MRTCSRSSSTDRSLPFRSASQAGKRGRSGLLAAIVKPVLKLLTLPLAILTLGLAWFFVAMFILWLTDAIVGGFRIDGFWTLVGATIVVWAVGAVADHWLFPKQGSMGRLKRA